MKRILGCMALGLATLAASAQWTNPSEDVPAYNASAPVKPLPPVLSGDQLTGIYFTHSYQVTTYKMAAAIPAVLHHLEIDRVDGGCLAEGFGKARDADVFHGTA